MTDLGFNEMFAMQRALQKAHEGRWSPLTPPQARSQLLYMIEELGESIAIIKKKGEQAIMEDPAVRENLCTELCDVLMYFNDVLLCYDITPEEIGEAYRKKHAYNMKRNYDAQNQRLYTESPLIQEGKTK